MFCWLACLLAGLLAYYRKYTSQIPRRTAALNVYASRSRTDLNRWIGGWEVVLCLLLLMLLWRCKQARGRCVILFPERVVRFIRRAERHTNDRSRQHLRCLNIRVYRRIALAPGGTALLTSSSQAYVLVANATPGVEVMPRHFCLLSDFDISVVFSNSGKKKVIPPSFLCRLAVANVFACILFSRRTSSTYSWNIVYPSTVLSDVCLSVNRFE